MRNFVAVVLLVLIISALGYLAPPAKYTLYYIDTTHNVSKVGIDSTGHPVGKPKRLTSGGKYDAYSVSPDEKYVVGIQNVKPMSNLDGHWTQYIEVTGGSRVTALMNGKAIWADGLPSVRWALSQGIIVYDLPGNVGYSSLLFTISGRKLPFESETDFIEALSSDQRLAFVRELVCCGNTYPGDFGIIDLRSGKRTMLMKSDSQEATVWFGKTHRFAFIDGGGRAWAGEVYPSDGNPKVTKWPLTRYGGCTDLRYIAGKGIYFVQRSSDRSTRAYLTSDLRDLRKTSGLPMPAMPNTRQIAIDRMLTGIRGAWTSTVSLTSDLKLLAVPVDVRQGGMPEIRVVTRDGKSVTIARGKFPHWTGDLE